MSENYGPNPSYEDLNVFNNPDISQELPVANMSLDVVEYVHGLPLPPCAMSFNGIIFEDAFPGYRTIRVEGRESFTNTIYDYSTRLNSGSKFQGSHEETKDITVTFAQHAYDYFDLKKRLDHLRKVLIDQTNQEAQIIFADEWDVFYVGSISSLKVEKLVNNSNASGQITIRCSDVRKYSVALSPEYEATPVSDGAQFEIDYGGTRPAYPVFKVKMPNCADVDYFGFVNQNGKILQFGTIQDVEKDAIVKPSNRINQNFLKNYPPDWGKSQDDPNPNYATVSTDMTNAISQYGSLNRDEDTGVHARRTTNSDGVIIFPGYDDNAPEDTSEITWHGPSTTRAIGSVDCKNWKFSSLITQWQREPNIDAVNVVLKNDYDVLACVGNKLQFDKTLNITYAAYEGTQQIPCKVTGVTSFLSAELLKNQPAKKNEDGFLRFKLTKGMTVESNDPNNVLVGWVEITFLATYSGGTKSQKKRYHWVINRLDPSASYSYIVLFQKYEFILDCDADHKTTNEYEVDIPFIAYKGKSRISATLATSAEDRKMFGIAPTVTNTTDKTIGHIKYNIPKGTVINVGSHNEASKRLTFNVTIDGKTQSVQDEFKIRRNTGSTDVSNGNSLVRVPLGNTSIVFPCRSNKTFLTKTIKITFGGWEGTSRRECKVNSVNLLNQKPTIKNATRDENGYIQWTIPANTNIPWETEKKQLTFTVSTDKYGDIKVVREITLIREAMTLTMIDYSQLGGMIIEVAGTNADSGNEMQSIAEIQLFKNQTKSTKATCSLYLNNLKKTSFTYECIKTNPITGTNNGKNKTGAPIEIEKIGKQYVFTIGGKKYSYSNGNNLIATEVSFVFLKFKTNNVLERNSVKNVKLIQYPITETIYEEIGRNGVSNFLYPDDEVEIDCGTGEVKVNGVQKYGFGQLGNDWEEFFLSPGPNTIQCLWDNSGKAAIDYEGNIYYLNQDFVKNSDYKKGQYWIVQNDANILGFDCHVGDVIYCINNKNGEYSHDDFILTTGDTDRVDVTYDPKFTMQYREVY